MIKVTLEQEEIFGGQEEGRDRSSESGKTRYSLRITRNSSLRIYMSREAKVRRSEGTSWDKSVVG